MNAAAALPPPLERPLRDLDAWVAWLQQAPIPVLAQTAAAIDELVDHEDAVDARMLFEVFAADPLATLRLLAHVATLQRGRAGEREGSQVETATAALVLLGIGPFFRAFAGLPSVEQRLAGEPQALEGLRRVLQRSYRASTFALAFAVHRADPDAQVIHEAAHLRDFAELLLWCHAPTLMAEIARRQAAEPTLRSAVAQRAVLGIELVELRHALMQAWRLPPLLVRLDDDHQAELPAVRCVLLAQRLARHSARGWDDPALPDDIRDIAELLQLGIEPTRRLLLSLDA